MEGPPKFRELMPNARRQRLVNRGYVSEALLDALQTGGLDDAAVDRLIENAVGVFGLPLGVATGMVVNGRKVVVPMAVEEPSVIAAQSAVATLVASCGGFESHTTGNEMIAQVQLRGVPDPEAAVARLTAAEAGLAERADATMPRLVGRGGGFRGLDARILRHPDGEVFVVVHLRVDVCDAMGANLLNTLAETLAPELATLAGGEAGLRILSNLADSRRVITTCRLPVDALAWRGFSGESVADGLVNASRFAEADPYRAVTHNKGIMNGVDALMVATGNDWRAVEAAAHAWAARRGRYEPLSRLWRDADGALQARLEMPLSVGTVGGSTRHHPLANGLLAAMGIESAAGLMAVAGAVGLAQNIAALRALGTEGIQEGHMRLHRRRDDDGTP